MGLMPNQSDLPPELLERELARHPGREPTRHQDNPGRGAGAQLEAGTGNERTGGRNQNEPNGLAKKVAKEWQSLLARPLKDAKDAIVSASKTWGMKLVFPNGAKEAMGGFASQIKPTAAGGTTPCPRLFAYGKCASRRCNCSHNLMREPSAAESRAFVDWVQTRCAEIKTNPGNF
jgi:hypothetical protein